MEIIRTQVGKDFDLVFPVRDTSGDAIWQLACAPQLYSSTSPYDTKWRVSNSKLRINVVSGRSGSTLSREADMTQISLFHPDGNARGFFGSETTAVNLAPSKLGGGTNVDFIVQQIAFPLTYDTTGTTPPAPDVNFVIVPSDFQYINWGNSSIVNNYYLVGLDAGTNEDVVRKITGFTVGSRTLTVASFPATLNNGDAFAILTPYCSLKLIGDPLTIARAAAAGYPGGSRENIFPCTREDDLLITIFDRQSSPEFEPIEYLIQIRKESTTKIINSVKSWDIDNAKVSGVAYLKSNVERPQKFDPPSTTLYSDATIITGSNNISVNSAKNFVAGNYLTIGSSPECLIDSITINSSIPDTISITAPAQAIGVYSTGDTVAMLESDGVGLSSDDGDFDRIPSDFSLSVYDDNAKLLSPSKSTSSSEISYLDLGIFNYDFTNVISGTVDFGGLTVTTSTAIYDNSASSNLIAEDNYYNGRAIVKLTGNTTYTVSTFDALSGKLTATPSLVDKDILIRDVIRFTASPSSGSAVITDFDPATGEITLSGVALSAGATQFQIDNYRIVDNYDYSKTASGTTRILQVSTPDAFSQVVTSGMSYELYVPPVPGNLVYLEPDFSYSSQSVSTIDMVKVPDLEFDVNAGDVFISSLGKTEVRFDVGPFTVGGKQVYRGFDSLTASLFTSDGDTTVLWSVDHSNNINNKLTSILTLDSYFDEYAGIFHLVINGDVKDMELRRLVINVVYLGKTFTRTFLFQTRSEGS